MAYVKVPKDLTKVKTKVALNLTKRQLIGFSIAGLLGFPVYLLCKNFLSTDISMILMSIVVLPIGEEIYSFTPIQHPANDMTTPIITTHFDYHSIDHNLLKLDILGHDDPTMIKMLEESRRCI